MSFAWGEVLIMLLASVGGIIGGLVVATLVFVPICLYQDIKDCERRWHMTWDPKWGPGTPYPDSDKPMAARMWKRLKSE